MPFTADHIAELTLLEQFDSPSTLSGIKIHSHQADPITIAAAERLHSKGLITQVDGGYLTPLGCETLEHTEKLLAVLADSST